MKIRQIIPLLVLVPLFGFVALQMVDQRRQAEAERARLAIASAPLDDSQPAAAAPEPAAPAPAEEPAPVMTSTGTSDPVPTQLADRDVDDIRRRIALGERGTYIDEILSAPQRDSALARWPERVMKPLRIFIANGSGLPDWNARYPDRVRDAFDTWSLAGAPVKFTFVRDSVDADVMVSWIDRFDAQITGRTLWSRDRNWWIVSGSIVLALHHMGGEVLDENAIHAIALHEVGHLLGLDHSSDTMNIMTARVRVHELSEADRATMRLLYSLPPGSIKR
jgi:hypothetical protein